MRPQPKEILITSLSSVNPMWDSLICRPLGGLLCAWGRLTDGSVNHIVLSKAYHDHCHIQGLSWALFRFRIKAEFSVYYFHENIIGLKLNNVGRTSRCMERPAACATTHVAMTPKSLHTSLLFVLVGGGWNLIIYRLYANDEVWWYIRLIFFRRTHPRLCWFSWMYRLAHSL